MHCLIGTHSLAVVNLRREAPGPGKGWEDGYALHICSFAKESSEVEGGSSYTRFTPNVWGNKWGNNGGIMGEQMRE